MAEKKKFLLRIDDSLYGSLEKWAADELRSINAQIEYILKDSLKKAGRLRMNTAPIVTEENEEEKEQP